MPVKKEISPLKERVPEIAKASDSIEKEVMPQTPGEALDTISALKLRNTNDTLTIQPVTKAVIQPEPDDQALKSGSKTSITSADSIKHIKAEFFLKRGQKAESERDFKNAEKYFKKSIELFNDYFDAWYALASFENDHGSLQRALKDYKTCAKIDSTIPKLYNNMGDLYLQLKQKTEAFDAYSKAILLKRKDIPSLMARANILTDWKRYTEALADYDMVLKLDRLYHYAYKARGKVKFLTKAFDEAVDDFTRFLIFEETDPSAYFYRGLAKIGNDELLDGCLDLSTSAGMGYSAAEKAIKKSCK
jgi:tetratricopeptide (TPR) repeat protein